MNDTRFLFQDHLEARLPALGREPIGKAQLGGPGGVWEGTLLIKLADLGGANRVPSLFLPHQEPKLLEEVILHQVQGERDPAHAELLAVLLGMLHAVGLQSIQGFQAQAKGVPVESREGSLSEEGMELGK